MKLRHVFLTASVVLPLCYGPMACAKDNVKLADDVETPDALLQETDGKNKPARYGDEDIKLAPEGRGDNEQVTPDPLEKNTRAPETKAEREKRMEEERKLDKAKESRGPTLRKPAAKGNEITTPDPIMDMLN